MQIICCLALDLALLLSRAFFIETAKRKSGIQQGDVQQVDTARQECRRRALHLPGGEWSQLPIDLNILFLWGRLVEQYVTCRKRPRGVQNATLSLYVVSVSILLDLKARDEYERAGALW